MRIGLFGGSFNPPHRGHRWLAEQFRRHGRLDQVWVLVAPSPPHKRGVDMAPYVHRLKMAEMNFGDLFGVEVNRVEESLTPPHYTVQTVEHLMRKHPGSEWALCLGQDSVEYLHTWHRAADLMELVDIVAIRRKGAADVIPEIGGKSVPVDYIDTPEYDASSTDIRTKIRSGEEVGDVLLPEVEEYIRNHRLYRI